MRTAKHVKSQGLVSLDHVEYSDDFGNLVAEFEVWFYWQESWRYRRFPEFREADEFFTAKAAI
jgi:hypothetical protein